MNKSSDGPPPIVEQGPTGTEAEQSLLQRIRQQEILSELGVAALQGATFDELLKETARLVAEGLRAEFSKVMEYIAAENRLLVRAGVGWDDNVIGVASVGADLESPAGYALHTGKPVISNHLENERRFRTPDLLMQHGVRRAMNVILQGDGTPFGVLEVDSRSEGEFSEKDIAFLQGAANILGMAIERQRYERNLKSALDRHELLLKEINHRVKNSLQVVVSMLQLQANSAGDSELSARLNEASSRVSSIGRAYEQLAYDSDNEEIDLCAYLRDVLKDVENTAAPHKLKLDAGNDIRVGADRAILVALITNELVTNAAKYAYPDGAPGFIWVSIAEKEKGTVLVTVRDEGVGLPAEFDPAKSKRLGARLVTALVRQLEAKLSQSQRSPGTEFAMLFPRKRPDGS